MKLFLLTTITAILSASQLYAQPEEKMQTEPCNYTFILADSLLNREMRLAKFSLQGGINRRAVKKIREDLKLLRGEQYALNETTFDGVAVSICSYKKIALDSITVKQDIFGPQYFQIDFTFKKNR